MTILNPAGDWWHQKWSILRKVDSINEHMALGPTNFRESDFFEIVGGLGVG